MPDVCLSTKIWRSGTGWFAQALAGALAEAGLRTAFVAPAAEPASREPVHPNLRRFVLSREIVVPAPRPARIRASLRRMAGGIAALARLRPTTRTFLFSIPEPLIVTLPVFAALRLTGARIVFIVHDPEPHAWRYRGVARRIERAGHALSYRLANHLVVLTPSAAQGLGRAFGVAAEKVSVIPHGPFTLDGVAPLPGQGRFLVFGTLRRNKGVLAAIGGVTLARRQGHDVRLVLAGEPHPDEPDYWRECEAAIRQDPEGFEVHRRFVPDEELPGILAGIDAFVLAYDGFQSQSGVGVLAAVNRRPVIGTRSGGLAELFDRGMAGETIEDPPSPEGVAAAIGRFRAVSAETWRLRAAEAAIRVTGGLSWPEIGRAYRALIERLENDRRPA